MRVIYKSVMKISILLDFFFFLNSHSLQTSSLYPLTQLQAFIGLEAIDYKNCIKYLGCVRHTNNTVKEPKVRISLLLANLQNFKNLSSNGWSSEMLIFSQMVAITCGRKLRNKDKLIGENFVPCTKEELIIG